MQTSRSTRRDGSVERLNAMSEPDLVAGLRACCAAQSWLDTVAGARPYASLTALLHASDVAVTDLDDAGLEQALAAHPRIGERAAGEGPEVGWSHTEQADALSAPDVVAAALAHGNRDYEQRFDRVFLIRASGRTAEQIHTELQARLRNDDETEKRVVRRELGEIVRLRLTALAHG